MKRVLRNFSALSFAEAIKAALGGIVTIYLARTLGADGFGIYGFAIAVLGYFETAVDGGMTLLGMREIARDRAHLRSHVQTILGLRLVLATLALACLVLFVQLVPKPEEVKRVVLLTGFSLFTYALLLDWVFYGLERASFVAIANVLKMMVFAGAVLLIVHGREQVWLLPPLLASGEFSAVLLMSAIFVSQFGFIRPGIQWRAWREVFVQSLPIGLSHVLRFVNYSFNVIWIGLALNEVSVGWFVSAQKLVLFMLGFGTLYFFAYLPSVAHALREGPAAVEPLLTRSIRLTALLTLPVAIGVTILAPQIINLAYGSAYANSAMPLQFLIWSVPLIIVSGHFRNVLIAANLQHLDVLWVALSALSNIVLNVLLISMWGMVGAAIATTLSELVLVVLGYWSVSRHIARPSLAGNLPRPLLAASLMAAAVWWGQNFGIAVSVALGALIYFAVLFLVGEIRPQQLATFFRSQAS